MPVAYLVVIQLVNDTTGALSVIGVYIRQNQSKLGIDLMFQRSYISA